MILNICVFVIDEKSRFGFIQILLLLRAVVFNLKCLEDDLEYIGVFFTFSCKKKHFIASVDNLTKEKQIFICDKFRNFRIKLILFLS